MIFSHSFCLCGGCCEYVRANTTKVRSYGAARAARCMRMWCRSVFFSSAHHIHSLSLTLSADVCRTFPIQFSVVVACQYVGNRSPSFFHWKSLRLFMSWYSYMFVWFFLMFHRSTMCSFFFGCHVPLCLATARTAVANFSLRPNEIAHITFQLLKLSQITWNVWKR